MSEPLTREDEGRHEPGEDFFWNESWYFDFFAADGSIGGYVRCGLYPNWDNRVWHTAFIVRPGGTSIGVVDYSAPMPSRDDLSIVTDTFQARLVCPEPSERWHLEMEATGSETADPGEMYRGEGKDTPVSWSLDWHTAADPFPYPAWTRLTRYEVPCRVDGTVTIDGTEVRVAGGGQRDHSHGPRGGWWKYAWLWAGFELDDGTKLQCNAVNALSGQPIMSVGYVKPPGEFRAVSEVTVETERSAEGLPRGARVRLEPVGLTVSVEPVAWGLLALPGPKGEISHFERALARFTTDDGRSGVGWVEWNTPQPAA
jgi:hypothetical protein